MSWICLTLFELKDSPIHIDTMMMAWSISYFKGSQVRISKFDVLMSLKIVFILAYSVDPDKMLHSGSSLFAKPFPAKLGINSRKSLARRLCI